MTARPRFYTSLLEDHLRRYRQMALVSGPRQVGKTTACRTLGEAYLNWDNLDDRRVIVKGPSALAERLELGRLRPEPLRAVLDELHKYSKWKGLLKGFYDTYADKVRLMVTGSSRIEVFRRGGDSLMGRYLTYRMHPFSVAECIRAGDLPTQELRMPMAPDPEDWEALKTHGGFPEPFIQRDLRFTRRWHSLRMDQLAREDLRDVTRVQDLGTLETLMRLLAERSGQQLIYSNLSVELGVTVDTVRRWVDLLSRLHFGFLVRPWFANVSRSLRKEPKWFLRDWSGIGDVGARAETLIACHLLKAVDGWTDMGFGEYGLFYLRDKQKREVDFVVVKDRKPWFLVEVKTGKTHLSPSLVHFQQQIDAPHAFQAVLDLPFVEADCFQARGPIVVPALTLLSQLL